MTLAYETDRVALWHADACDKMPTIETESVSLIVTDPPYGKEYASGFRKESFGQIDNDTPADRDGIRGVLAQCARVTKQGRHLYVFGPTDVLDGLKVSETTALVWDKGIMGSGDLTSSWGPSHEPITFAVTKYRHGGQAGKGNLAVRMRKGTVLKEPRPTGRKVRHPNEKPVRLLRELIESSSRAGDLVCDPFAGSGSTGVAALLSDRHVLLIEKDERWIPLIIDRLKIAEELLRMGYRV